MNWYGSLYSFFEKVNWKFRPMMKDITFHQFVDLMLEHEPMSQVWYNFVDKQLIMASYLTPKKPQVYMIQYENMYAELAMVMNKFGFEVTPGHFRNTLRQNERRELMHGNMGPQFPPALTPKQRERILEVDKPIFDLYERHDAIVAEWQTR